MLVLRMMQSSYKCDVIKVGEQTKARQMQSNVEDCSKENIGKREDTLRSGCLCTPVTENKHLGTANC